MKSKKTREQIVHNILARFAQKKGLVKYEYPDVFMCLEIPIRKIWLIKNMMNG